MLLFCPLENEPEGELVTACSVGISELWRTEGGSDTWRRPCPPATEFRYQALSCLGSWPGSYSCALPTCCSVSLLSFLLSPGFWEVLKMSIVHRLQTDSSWWKDPFAVKLGDTYIVLATRAPWGRQGVGILLGTVRCLGVASEKVVLDPRMEMFHFESLQTKSMLAVEVTG